MIALAPPGVYEYQHGHSAPHESGLDPPELEDKGLKQKHNHVIAGFYKTQVMVS